MRASPSPPSEPVRAARRFPTKGGLCAGAILCLCHLATPASAASPPRPDAEAVAGCRTLEDAKSRLECYDTVSGRTPTEVVADDPKAEGLRRTTLKPPSAPPTPLAERWELEAQTDRGPFVITSYKPNYLLVASYQDRIHKDVYTGLPKDALDSFEVKFQISAKTKVWPDLLSDRGDLWLGYTQVSYWQAYNTEFSAPFRETVYEPEVIYAYRTGFSLAGFNSRLVTLALNHQSNGRSDPRSRSWNRVVLSTLWDREANRAIEFKAWWRIPEDDKDDDNPDISDRVGRGEVWGYFKHNAHTFAAMYRTSFDPGTAGGATQLDWSFPLGGAFKGYVQYFYGYGDGLIDYDHLSHRLSLGFLLTDWM